MGGGSSFIPGVMRIVQQQFGILPMGSVEDLVLLGCAIGSNGGPLLWSGESPREPGGWVGY